MAGQWRDAVDKISVPCRITAAWKSADRNKKVWLNLARKWLQSGYVGLVPDTARADFSRSRKTN